MFRFLADHDLHDAIVRDLMRRADGVDIVRVREIADKKDPDEEILERAAQEDRIVLSHDRKTMTRSASERVDRGKKMPGLFIVEQTPDIGRVVGDLLLIIRASETAEWENLIEYLPFPRPPQA